MLQPAGLIRRLFIYDGDVGVWDDAAMDLGAFDEPEAEQALITVGSDPLTDAIVAASCGESLAQIWQRQNRLPVEVLKQLRPEALSELHFYIRQVRPELPNDPCRSN